MSLTKALAIALAAIVAAACTTPYQKMGMTGGYEEKRLENGDWQIYFLGNGFTTPETVQTMWLYRCTLLTLEKGFQGFEIVTPMQLSGLKLRRVQLAQSSMMPDIIGQTVGNMAAAQTPRLQGTIRLLNAPFTPVPGKVFDAAALKAILEPLVTKLCNGNVCRHDHYYLRATGNPG
jgi:hypothetical protein